MWLYGATLIGCYRYCNQCISSTHHTHTHSLTHTYTCAHNTQTHAHTQSNTHTHNTHNTHNTHRPTAIRATFLWEKAGALVSLIMVSPNSCPGTNERLWLRWCWRWLSECIMTLVRLFLLDYGQSKQLARDE